MSLSRSPASSPALMPVMIAVAYSGLHLAGRTAKKRLACEGDITDISPRLTLGRVAPLVAMPVAYPHSIDFFKMTPRIASSSFTDPGAAPSSRTRRAA